MKRILTVLGARPQFIKASVVSRAIASSRQLEEQVVHTGQHFDDDMSNVFFDELGMAPPTFHLGIHGGSHGAMTGKMLAGVEEVILSHPPDAVLVYGDTNSTLAGALAAVKLHVPVAHVEAGLRSFNLNMPEEVNRILTDRISRWLFTPTQTAEKNLRDEGVRGPRIVPVGDVMFDVARYHGSRMEATGRVLGRLGLSPGGYVLATVHRAENTDDPERLATIVDALEAVTDDIPVVWPLHPRSRAALQRDRRRASGLHLIDPVGYLDMVQLEKHAALVATDSGGVQKEAFFHRIPCVTLRPETEWVELIDAGWNRLSPPESAEAVTKAITDALGTTGSPIDPFGSGDAAERIVAHLAADVAS